MEMNEGYQDREDPGSDHPPAADRPARRIAPRLDDHALDAHLERGRGRRPVAALRSCPPGRRRSSGWPRGRSRRPSRDRSRSSRRWPGPIWSAGATRVPSTTCPPSARPSRRAPATTPTTRISTAWSSGARSARTRGPASSTSRRAAVQRTSSSARRSGCRWSAPLDESGVVLDGFGSLTGRDVRDVADPIIEHLEARRPVLPARDDRPPLSALLEVQHAARLPAGGRVVHQHGPAVRPAARDAHPGAGGRQPPLPDHGRRGPDPVDPGVRVRARARLAPQHARLDDQQEALLGARAADLRLRGVRHDRGDRRARGAARARCRGLGDGSRATRRTGRTWTP